MRISKRGRNDNDDTSLRSMLIHRLRDASKAVLRIPLRSNLATADRAEDYSVHCEPCNAWFTLPEWGEEIRHGKCGRVYALELAVFSEITESGRGANG